jgi:hypothetical protein
MNVDSVRGGTETVMLRRPHREQRSLKMLVIGLPSVVSKNRKACYGFDRCRWRTTDKCRSLLPPFLVLRVILPPRQLIFSFILHGFLKAFSFAHPVHNTEEDE